MHRLCRLTLCGFSLLAMVATASAEPIVPVNDDPPMAGFPEGAVLDVLGIKLGMTPDEVRAAYDGELTEYKRTLREVNPDNGAVFEVEYVHQLTTRLPPRGFSDPIGIENVLEVTFGSPFIANRAVRVSNTYHPPADTPISPKGFMQLLEKKYGPASGVFVDDNDAVWSFGPNGQVSIPQMPDVYNEDNNQAGFLEPGVLDRVYRSMPMCLLASEFRIFSKTTLPYKFDTKRFVYADGCVGGLTAYPGKYADTSPRTVVAIDQRRVNIDNAALDAAVKLAHTSRSPNVMEPKL